jgi:hypothetical protein
MRMEQAWEHATCRIYYENRLEWNGQLCFPELFRSCLAVPANRPRLQSAAAVNLLVASKRMGSVSAPGNAIGQDFWELKWD